MGALSKFTLYDFLAILVPGGIIVILLLNLDICEILGNDNSTISTQYSCECLCHCSCETISKIIPKWLSNYPEWLRITIFIVSSYFVGLLNRSVADLFFSYFRNNNNMIHASKLKVYEDNDAICSTYTPTKGNHKEYYKAYCKLAEKNLLGAIPILEGQIALLRNSIIPLIATIIYLLLIQKFCWVILFISGAILCYLIMNKLQNKIYDLVWEGQIYYDKSEKKQ